MGAFLENPMFLFVDDTEPILPIFRPTGPSLRSGDISRIVELADVGCDTEATFPVHFPRGGSDRRRGGAENLGSARRNAKWHRGRPNEFVRRAIDVNNNEVRNRYHARGRGRRDDYDDVYVADLNYDDPEYAESPYDDLELSMNDSDDEAEEDYARFVDPRSTVARSRTRERKPRYDYSGDYPVSSFTQGTRVLERERSTSPRWFVENDEENGRYEMRGTNVHPAEPRKRTKFLSRANGGFNREAEFEKIRAAAARRERDGPADVADPDVAPTKNIFSDFIPFENGAEREGAAFRKPTRTKNPGGLQKTAPHGRRSYIFDSQPKRAVDSQGEEEFKETPKKDRRGNLSPESPMNSARRRATRGDAVKETKTLRLTSNLGTSSRGRSMKAPIERISNMYPAEKDSNNTRPHSATTEGRKIKSPTIDRKEEVKIVTEMTADDRRYHNKFNKLSNNSPKETGRSTRTFNQVAEHSKNNGRMYVANKRDDANTHRGNSKDTKIDRINVAVSRLAPEKKLTKNERTFTLRTTGVSAPHTDMEKEKERKFSSRLPIRVWKRLKTKAPAALRPKNDATNEDVDRKDQGVENETARSGDHSVRVKKNDDVRVKDRAASRNNVKRTFQNRIGP